MLQAHGQMVSDRQQSSIGVAKCSPTMQTGFGVQVWRVCQQGAAWAVLLHGVQNSRISFTSQLTQCLVFVWGEDVLTHLLPVIGTPCPAGGRRRFRFMHGLPILGSFDVAACSGFHIHSLRSLQWYSEPEQASGRRAKRTCCAMRPLHTAFVGSYNLAAGGSSGSSALSSSSPAASSCRPQPAACGSIGRVHGRHIVSSSSQARRRRRQQPSAAPPWLATGGTGSTLGRHLQQQFVPKSAGSNDASTAAAAAAEPHEQHGHEQVEPGSRALHPEALVSLYGWCCAGIAVPPWLASAFAITEAW